MDLPFFCIIGDRPVKAIETESGGMEVMALNWKNGNFERDMQYLDRIISGDIEVSVVDKCYLRLRMDPPSAGNWTHQTGKN